MIEVGKLAGEDLKRLLKCIKSSPRVVVHPAPGLDSGVHLIDEDKCLVISTDPCLGVPESWFGWLLIHYAASDVALFGAKPEFCTITILGPPSTEAGKYLEIMKQVCDAADELGVTIVTGHTGNYDGLSTLVGSCTAYGLVSRDRLITPGGSRIDDHIILMKSLGLETVVNFSLKHRALAERIFGVTRANALRNLVGEQTCVREASVLAKVKGVHAMHDATEGGLVAALNEMADYSNLGFNIDLKSLPILHEARILQKKFNLSLWELLSLSSTGAFVAAIDSQQTDNVLQRLHEHHMEASLIGVFLKDRPRLLREGKKTTIFPSEAEDPYGKIMSMQ